MVTTKNSKHIEIHYYYVHESVRENEIEIIKIDSNDNVADIFTKALCKNINSYFFLWAFN